jgi:endonuclease/exonuclease/phosphatase family metal-dependent hydrolase
MEGTMQLANGFMLGPIYWRIFDPGDTAFVGGVREGTLRPGAPPLDYNHPSGRFKIEIKRDGIFGRVLVSAGEIFANADQLNLTAAGRLERVAPVPRPPLQPQPLPTPASRAALLLRVMAWNCYEGVAGDRVVKREDSKCMGPEGTDDPACPKHAPGWAPTENRGLPALAEIIKSQAADIVLLNEVMYWRGFPFSPSGSMIPGIGRNQVTELQDLTGMPHMQYIEVNALGWSGIKLVGILSRYPLGAWSKIDNCPGFATLKTSFSANGRNHHVYSTRFKNIQTKALASDTALNLACHQTTAQSINALRPDEAVILGGDLNCGAGHVNAQVLRDAGLTFAGAPTDQIDHILVRGPYASQRAWWDSPPTNPSDHGFVVADLASRPGSFHAAYGDVIKLRHGATGHILHSHGASYGHPGSSRQQQITAFAAADDNDYWLVKGPHGTPDDHRRGQPVRHGEVIRLEHVATRRNLHSHAGFPSPRTGQQEVTGFGANGQGDGNDDWRIEVEDAGAWEAGERVRLIHVNTNHALHSHAGLSHPQWTLGQQEVTGFPQRDDNDWWRLFEVR